MLRVLKRLGQGLLALLALVLSYFAVAYALVLFPANRQDRVEPVAVNAFVLNNGAHTDLVFPIRAAGVDWSQVFPAEHFERIPADAGFIAIGWGDREFYLNTPEWKDLTATRAVMALSGSGTSLLHVTYLREADLQQSGVHAMPLSTMQYDSLVRHVNTALVRTAGGAGVNLPGRHYGAQDAFYEARGAYDLFTTCNVWTGRGLRHAGVKVSAWTPLASQVVWHLPLR